MFTAALFTIAKRKKQQPKCQSMDDEQIKMWQPTHTYTQEYYPDIRMKEILQFSTICMNLQGIMLTEINQIGKNKYCVISFTCGI